MKYADIMEDGCTKEKVTVVSRDWEQNSWKTPICNENNFWVKYSEGIVFLLGRQRRGGITREGKL